MMLNSQADRLPINSKRVPTPRTQRACDIMFLPGHHTAIRHFCRHSGNNYMPESSRAGDSAQQSAASQPASQP